MTETQGVTKPERGQTARSELILILAAVIWGFAFAFQKSGAKVGAFSFVTLRMTVALLVLGPILAVRGRRDRAAAEKRGAEAARARDAEARAMRQSAWRGGLLCGIFYFLGTALQQMGLAYISAGRSGFLTAVYTVLVPIFSIALGKKVPRNAWAGAFLCLGGLYLLCMAGSGASGFGVGDVLTILCAFAWTCHVLAIDRFAPHVDGMMLSFVQSAAALVLSLPVTFFIERPSWAAVLSIWPSILYVGVFSTAVAYTLQIVGQRHVPPTQATITLSLESVFSVVGGALLLGERMTAVQYAGCALIFCATVLAQLPDRRAGTSR